MKVQYIGETKAVQTVDGKEARIEKGTEYECMEKEYHSASIVRVHLTSGDKVKVKRGELKKV